MNQCMSQRIDMCMEQHGTFWIKIFLIAYFCTVTNNKLSIGVGYFICKINLMCPVCFIGSWCWYSSAMSWFVFVYWSGSFFNFLLNLICTPFVLWVFPLMRVRLTYIRNKIFWDRCIFRTWNNSTSSWIIFEFFLWRKNQ